MNTGCRCCNLLFLKCEICGKEFKPRRDKFHKARFCSKTCNLKFTGFKTAALLHQKWSSETHQETQLLMQQSLQRFVEKKDGCWFWTGALKSIEKLPYGNFVFHGKRYIAHRASFIAFKGEIPKDKLVLHTCDNAKCINPDHLYLGTYLDNQNDKRRRGRCIVEKLNEGQVKEIKKLLLQGLSLKEIGKMFNVSSTNVMNIRNEKIWAWVKI